MTLKSFYVAALAPLGYTVLREFAAEQNIGYIGVGLGVDPKPDFWIGAATGAPTGRCGVQLTESGISCGARIRRASTKLTG